MWSRRTPAPANCVPGCCPEVGSNARHARARFSRMFGLSTEATLTIVAVFAGPIVALLTQRALDHLRERRGRRLTIFRVLMGTRAAALSQAHVDALNQIDVEFYGWRPAHKKVIAAWKALRNHLGDSAFSKNDFSGWLNKIVDLRVDLLHEMAKALGYKFEKDDILRNVYAPIAHGDIEDDQRLIRKGVVELLTGKRALSTLAWLCAVSRAGIGSSRRTLASATSRASRTAADAHPEGV